MDRYGRQIILRFIGKDGQETLKRKRVSIIGCGATGGNTAMILSRMGIGFIRLIDRDVVEVDNLHRQFIYTEEDIGIPKAIAASQNLHSGNTNIKIEAIIDDIRPENIECFTSDVDLIIDGTDNMETRFLINDAAVKNGIPWIYQGAIETQVMCMPIIPGKTACLRCLIPELPPAGALPTCETIGIMPTAPMFIASMTATTAIKILLDYDIEHKLLIGNLWELSHEKIDISRRDDCLTCSKKNFEFLNGKFSKILVMCSSGTYQIMPSSEAVLNFEDMKKSLENYGTVKSTDYTLKFIYEDKIMHIFRDGRCILKNCKNESEARNLYSRFVGL